MNTTSAVIELALECIAAADTWIRYANIFSGFVLGSAYTWWHIWMRAHHNSLIDWMLPFRRRK